MFADLPAVVNSLRMEWHDSDQRVRAMRAVVATQRDEIIRQIQATGVSVIPLPDGRVLTIRRAAS